MQVGINTAAQTITDPVLARMDADRIVDRIWQKDITVWSEDPTELSNRLGWLDCPEVTAAEIENVTAVIDSLGLTSADTVLLLGMGGSSLAPEVFAATLPVKPGGPRFAVLDSTAPDAVLAWSNALDPQHSYFIVSTKSGGTIETFSFFRYFYRWLANALGAEEASAHVLAITDPGSGLAKVAEEAHLRATFINDPNIGGRYSALSLFGVAPSILIGADAVALLDSARNAAEACKRPTAENPGAVLGAAMGALAAAGKDKLTLVASRSIMPIGPWIEQLVAESTGKNGVGILPVAGEDLAGPDTYAADRVFVDVRQDGEARPAGLDALEAAGFPVITMTLPASGDASGRTSHIGALMFIWEFATALSGWVLGIQPFDQPNVESAKILARKVVADYEQSGTLVQPDADLIDGEISVYAGTPVPSVDSALKAFLAQADQGEASGSGRSYVALQAYLPPNDATSEALQALRTVIQHETRLATTVGYGPRFLHSTGQLHKGDAGHGLFLQFTSRDAADAPIPVSLENDKSTLTFGVLKLSQALGDGRALSENRRRLLRFDLGNDSLAGLARLTAAVKEI